MRSMVEASHAFLEPVLRPGAVCVDATLGKGKDTLFLLKHPIRKVYAFEIQEEWIQKAKETVRDERLILVPVGHEQMDRIREPVDAIVFNLGYCPGDPDGIHTQAATTLTAVQKGLALLQPQGRMAIVCYPHPAGKEESDTLIRWLEKHHSYSVLSTGKENAPFLIQIIQD